MDEFRQPKGAPTDPNRLTALHLLSLLAVFSGFLLGFISGYEFFYRASGIGALLLTVGGTVLFLAGLALKVRVDRAWAVEGDREAGLLRQGEQAKPTKASRATLLVIAMATLLSSQATVMTADLELPPWARPGAAVVMGLIFLLYWLVSRLALGKTAEQAYGAALLAGLGTVFVYLGVLGLFLPRRVWEKDLTFRRLLWGLGIRSLLALRLAGLFFLSTVAGITWFLVIPSLLGRLR